MHRKLFIVGVSILILIMLFVACLSYDKNKVSKTDSNAIKESGKSLNDSFWVRPLTNIKYLRTVQRLKRGQYLTEGLLQCFTCHSPRNWEEPGAPPLAEKKGSGGTIVNEDSTSLIIAPNITPDEKTGAGTWSDDMLARAIREGVGHDGRALSGQMPYAVFRNLSDEDMASVIVYLHSLQPVHNIVPPVKMPVAQRSEIEKSLKLFTKPVETPDLSDPMKRGKYLVKLGECGGCHTSHADYNPGLFAGGNHINRFGLEVFSANITSDPSGMAYGPEGFIFVIRTGKGGTLSPIMPWIAFKNISDDDLKVMYAYLHTIPPSHHSVSNQIPFTRCAICGMEHGMGDKNKREKPAGIKLDPALYDLYAGTYLIEKFDWSVKIVREGSKLIFQPWENGPKIQLIPQSEAHFLAPGWILPVSFVKDKNGHVTHMVEDSDEGMIYKKIN